MNTRRFLLIFKVLLVLFGVGSALIAAELLVRVFSLAPDVGYLSVRRFRLSANSDVGYEPVPFYVERDPKAEDIHYFAGFTESTNSLGLRDTEHSLRPASGTSRILFIGDSVTMGFGIDDRRQLFAALTGELLQNTGHSVETMNFGVSGYNTWQEVALLEANGVAYSPGVVVLQYCLNDDHDNWPANHFIVERLLERSKESGAAVQTLGSAFAASALFRLFAARFHGFAAPAVTAANYDFRPLDEDRVLLALKKLKQLSQASHFKVLVVGIPGQALDRFPQDKAELDGLVTEARALGFAAENALPTLLECSQGGEAQFIDGFHLSAAGHQCVAAALAQWLTPLLSTEG